MFKKFHKVYRPHPLLAAFVNNIMIQRVELDRNETIPIFTMPPIQEQAIFFYPLDIVNLQVPSTNQFIELPRSVVVAKRINRINVVMGYNHLVVKVGFQPGGLFRLLGIPIYEFKADETVYESASLVDKEIPFIVEQLNKVVTQNSVDKRITNAGTISQQAKNNTYWNETAFELMVGIIQKWLMGKLSSLKKEKPIDKVLPALLRNDAFHNISEVASQSCVSVRQLERLFQQRIGLPPQYYARLVRFTKAWIIKENYPMTKWSNLAYQCGYFDQMHLIRDFKEFTGTTPSYVQNDLQNIPFSLQHEVFH